MPEGESWFELTNHNSEPILVLAPECDPGKTEASMEHSRDDREHQCDHAGYPQYVARCQLLSHAGI